MPIRIRTSKIAGLGASCRGVRPHESTAKALRLVGTYAPEILLERQLKTPGYPAHSGVDSSERIPAGAARLPVLAVAPSWGRSTGP